ncbi:PadR family transcriptional regulator [Sanguibacter antarcticus]|uniref:PadR family transcriptional regulator n=1 Tax=Sanguibacter antarcticus TaxID=372484 RepID=A0A2A9E9U8_9MICO|nr:PadR family transcriptional regulator [Sanguibacter antarcticus]PFG35055.1 PadR family transcriptional regulator [Sanguibacter antarcticus]
MATPFRTTRQSYLILLALAGQERQHGYAVIKLVSDLSDGEVTLGAGTLYGNIDRLLDAGLVETAGEEVVGGRQRRYYRATAEGAALALEETQRLAALAARAETILGARPVTTPVARPWTGAAGPALGSL